MASVDRLSDCNAEPGPPKVTSAQIELSVIVPTLNGARVCNETFAALAAETTDFVWEVVCADNGSTDETVALLKAWANSFDTLRLVDASAERGVGFARNVGVSASRGKQLIFIDQDDVIQTGYLKAMSVALTRAPLVAARMDGRLLNPGAHDRILQVDEVPVAFDRLPGASGGSLGMHRDLFDRLGGFDTTVGVSDDIDFCWRAQLSGVDITFVPDAVLMYRYRSNFRALFGQGVRYGVAASIMHRRYAGVAPVRNPDAPRARAELARRVRQRDPGVAHDLAHALGWRVGMLKGRRLPAVPLPATLPASSPGGS